MPVTVCGNAVSVASNVTNAKCLAGKAGPKQPKGNKPPKGSPGAGGTSTKKISGALNGTTAVVDIGGVLLHIPINVCGNSVAVAANITNGAC